VDYSEHLLELARMSTRRPIPVVGAPMPGSALPTRITKILDGRIGPPGSRTAAAGGAALATLAAAVLGTVTLAQEPVPPARAQQTAAPTRAQEPTPPGRVPETTAPQGLLEVYQLALANDPIVREAEAEYRALAAASPQARNAIAESMADYDAARQELLIRVAEPYFGVFAAESTLTVQEAAREALSRQLEQTQRRFEVGLIAVTDVQETQGGFDQAVANALTARRALAAAEDSLREVVGEPVGPLRPLVEDLPLTVPDPSDAEAWIATALQRNPTLVSTRIRAGSADGDVEARRSADEDLERIERRTASSTRAAYLGVVSEISRALALEKSVRSNETALKATHAAFEVGTRTTVDVLAAQRTLRQSELAYALSRYDYARNVLRLRAAAGELTDEGLEETRSWFE
jgi:hypothetical protein